MKHTKQIALITLLALTSGCAELDLIIGYGEEFACDNIDPSTVNPDWDKSHCYKDAADRKNTPETCAKVEESAPRTKCYMELAEELGQPSLCDKLQDRPTGQDYSRLECLQRTAVANGDQTICDQMGTATYNGFIQTYNREECKKAVDATPPIHPEKGGFDPTDTDAATGGVF